MVTHNTVYEKRIVAFVDILGFKTIIEDSINDISLRQKVLEVTKIIHSKRTGNIEDIQVTTFSDSAVISYPLNMRNALFYTIIDIIHLQLELGHKGIMLRGGIAIGDLYHNEDIVFGPAMNEAYYLESKVAKFPRIVIRKEDLNKGFVNTEGLSKHEIKTNWNDLMNLVTLDTDNNINNNENIYFIDFLRQDNELTYFGDEYYEWLKAFRGTIVEGLNRYNKASDGYQSMKHSDKKEADKIFEKYRWLLYHWNNVVGDEDAFYPVPDVMNKKGFRTMYKTLAINKRYPYL